MKMKKTLSLLLALVLSLGLLAGCGGDSNDQPAQNDTPQQEDTTTPPADDTASDAEPAPTEDVTAKIMELKGGTIDGVNVLAELKALKQQNAQRDADEAVTLALKAGKITPAQKDWARSYALADPKGFGAFVEKAPQVVPMGEVDLGGSVALKSDKPDEATTLVCKQLGVSQEDLEKYGKEE